MLLIVADACRPDKLGAYGFERPTSPAIDRFAEDPDSVVFQRHYVQGDWTKPSTASLFTGLYVYQHRVALGPEAAQTPYWTGVLPATLETLAEKFQGATYLTFGAVRIPHLHPKYGFNQGFEEYGYLASDRQVVEETLRLVETADRPFFGYLHLLACHDPYPGIDLDPGYLEKFGFPYDAEARKAAGIDFTDPDLSRRIGPGGIPWEADDFRYLHLLNEAKLRACDRNAIGPLLDGLRQRDLYDNTLIVLTADHGQELLEHGGYSHAHALWEEVIHVPLVVKFPKGRRPIKLGERWTRTTRSIDLYPSLLAAARIDPPDDLPGVNLFRAPEIDFALSERFSAGAEVDWAMIRGTDKVLRVLQQPVRLFDLQNDPGEQHDLALARAETVAEFQNAVEALRVEQPIRVTDLETVAPELTPEEREILRSLGYLR